MSEDTDSTAPLEIADRVLEIVGDRAEAMVRVGVGTSALTRFANSMIHQNVVEDTQHVSLTAAVDGRVASATVNQTDPATLNALVTRVLDAAALRPADPEWPGLAPPTDVSNVEHYDDATAAATPAQRADIVKAFVDAGAATQAAGFCSTSASTIAFANSLGHRIQRRHSSATVDGIHQAGEGVDGSAHQESVRLGDLDGAAVGAEAARKARQSADPVDLEAGTYEVVLDVPCVVDMLQFLARLGFNGKAFLEGRSFVRLDEQQFDPSVSVWDDAADPRTTGLPFDHEGTPKHRLDLVTGGLTQAVVHDRRSAHQAGGANASTGHSVGMGSFGAVPANLFFGAGDRTFDELMASVERGLLVSDFWYTRILDPKTQVVTGLTRNGLFLIEDGKASRGVKNLRFTQSYAGAFGPGKVKGIGSEARLFGGYHVPPVHLAAFHFTGGARG